jgi:hypothetical protein
MPEALNLFNVPYHTIFSAAYQTDVNIHWWETYEMLVDFL